VKDFYEDLWERLPAEPEIPDRDRRERLLRQHLREGDRVLDLGCGTGWAAALAHARGAATSVGADVAEAALARARAAHAGPQFELVPFDGPLPFDDNAFDLVWASEVIEHVADTARWLSEVRRVLGPGGRLLLTTPDHGRLRLLVGGIERYCPPLGDHLHLYTGRSLRTLLDEFGFDGVAVTRRGASLHARATR
jgi:ubiquinone/menaquinone biosynthesis C-methylase UbiE